MGRRSCRAIVEHNKNKCTVQRFRLGRLPAVALRGAGVRQARPIGPFDVPIAGQARARGLVLVTRNSGEFGRVPGLRIEDWEAG
jgi:predicted nucleic acid-binding protein